MTSREQDFVQKLKGDAGWHFHYMDVPLDHAGFLRLSLEEFQRSPFLDGRLQLADPDRTERALLSLRALLDAWPDSGAVGNPHFVFHPGHCGSTLVSRLVDAMGGVLGLREPLPLRALAAQWREQGSAVAQLSLQDYARLERFVLGLLGRTFSGQQCTLVKATSECCNLAGRVADAVPHARFIWIWTDLETFLATMLRNKVRREEVVTYAQSRLMDLNRWLDAQPLQLYRLDLTEKAAMNWVSSMCHLSDLQNDAHVMALRFDSFNQQPQEWLERIAAHLDLPDPVSCADRAVQSGVLDQYSKDASSRFNVEDRRRQLEQSRAENAEAIERGIAMARFLLEGFPALRFLQPMLHGDRPST